MLQVFNVSSGQREVSEQTNGHQRASESNGLNGAVLEEEYQLKAVAISKTKQSLGKSHFILK